MAPSEDQLELDVLAATGWVERVRRSGSHAGEVSRPAPTEEELRNVVHPPKPTPAEVQEEREELRRETRGEASEEERKDMRRYARLMSAGAAQTPRMIAVSAWSLVLLGILFASLLPVVLAILVVIQMYFPHSFHHTANDGVAFVSLFIMLALLMIAGLSLMWYGVRLLRRSRRMRRLSEAPPESVTGEIVCWMPYWDIWSSSSFQKRGETLIKSRAADGSEHIFRVPNRYLHRVRRRGAWVRVTYQAGCERVLDVAYAEEPVAAPTGDESERP